MGDPRRQKKKFKKPGHPFEKERILEELDYLGKFGLRNKREFWKFRTMLGNWRSLARQSRALTKDKAMIVQQSLIQKLQKLGILGPEAQFEDVLVITIEDVLKRRLQTIVFEKGLAKSIYEARQRIVHNHIQVGNKRINAPSYIVNKEEEELITFAPTSPFTTAG